MSDTITICFYGSSDHELEVKLADFYQNDIYLIVDSILELQNTNIKIVTGGYGGIMNSIAEKFASKKKDSGKNIEIVGITCDAYDFENPDAKKYNKSNDYSVYNDVIIQSENFTERVQSMIELSDLFIVLPGKQGTLSELLITCESYSFGKYILNGKETKILVHEYWEPILSDVSYFRKFNTDILTFFNSSSFVELIKSYTNNSTKNVAFSQTRNATKADWHERMTELKGNICKVILSRVYNEKELLQRLNRDNEFPILGLDFGWFHLYQGSGQDGEYHSYSTEKYISLTEKFFANYNSIMLSNFHKEFEYDYLDGNINSDENLNYYTGESIPQYDSNKNKSSFSELRNLFNKQKYGQTLIWKGLKTELDGGDQNDTDVLIFSIFLLLKHRIPRSSIQKINQLLSDFLLKASATKSGELFKEKDKDIINQATRAAISQVMARNTSHNIGAHVMNKLIGDLNYDTLFKKKNYNSVELITLYTETIKKWNQDRLKDNKPELTEEEQKQKILLDQISIFNNYVKCRMDYLADISFGTPLMQTNKYAYADLFKELDKVRLLLEHISGLDNFEFEIKFTRNGKEFKKDNQGEGEDDLLVAIPNDILGTQAFYNILENIIRNSAKHSDKSKLGKNENVVFTVNFIDNVEKVDGYCNDEKCDRTQCNKAHQKEIENTLNEFIAVEVYDNIPVDSTVNPIPLEKKEIDEFKRMMGNKEPKFETYIDYLVFKQNNKLNEDILQENKLRSYSLGLVEMDASAAYLRKRPVEFINHRSYDIQYDESWSRNTEKNKEEGRDQVTYRGTNCRHFLKAFKKEVKKDDGKTESYLGYRFFLHRPAVVLVVTELLKDDKEKKEKLRKEGIWLIEPKDFEKDLKEGKVFPHEFVVYSIEENNTIESLIHEYKTSLPIKTLEFAKDELINILKEQDCDKKKLLVVWEEFSWNKWYKGDSTNPKLEVDIIKPKMDKKNGDTVTSLEAVYLDHLYSDTNETPQDMWNKETYATHLEALSSLAQSKLPDFAKLTENVIDSKDKLKKYLEVLNYYNVVTQNMNVITHHKIAESVLTKVIVIDERIQNTTKEPSEGGREFMTIPFRELYNKMGVIVPDKALNLSENSFDTIKIEIEKFIESEIKKAKPMDFILIHYSILERMYEKDQIKDKLEDWSKSINVVVTSGRGIPNNLSEKVRFVNLSSVISSFVDVRSKYAINYLSILRTVFNPVFQRYKIVLNSPNSQLESPLSKILFTFRAIG